MRKTGSVSLRRVHRDASRMRLRLLGIAAILGMAVGIYVGIHSAVRSLFATRDAYYHTLHRDDVAIRFVPDNLAKVPNFSDIAGVAAWRARLVAPGQLVLANGERFPTQVVAKPVPSKVRINSLVVLKGQPLSAAHPDEVLIDRNFAAYHHIRVGDHLKLKMGGARFALTIRGIALSPEYLTAPADPNVFLPIKGSLGVIYAPEQMVSSRLGFTPVDSLVFRLKPSAGKTRTDLIAALTKRAQSALSVRETLPRSHQLSYMFMNVDLGSFSIFIPAVIVIFLLAALTVGFFLIYRWVQAQRETLGIFLALGYRRRRLLAVELYPVALIAVAALLIAIPVTFIALEGFARTYSAAVGLPALKLAIYPAAALRGALALLAVVFAMAAWPLISILSLSPVAAIRGGPPVAKQPKGRQRRFLNSLRHHPLIIFPLRNIVRELRIDGMTMVAVALAIGVSVSYFVAAGSFTTAVARSYTADRWNVAVDFLVPVRADELGAFHKDRNIKLMEGVLRGPVRIEANGRSQPARVTSYTPGTTMRRPNLTSGVLPAEPGGGIVLEHKLAAGLGLRAGDTLHLVSGERTYRLRVAGIFSGAIPDTAYAPLADVQRWLAMPDQLSGLLLDMREPSAAALGALSRLPRVGAVTPKTDLVAKVEEISREALSVIYLAAAFSITVSVIILIASSTFTVSERREQYTTLRTLGFSDKIVGRFILVELCLLGIFGVILAVPLGYGMAAFLVARLSKAWFHVSTWITWYDVLLPTAPLLALLPLSAIPPIRAVMRVRLAEAIKQRRYG